MLMKRSFYFIPSFFLILSALAQQPELEPGYAPPPNDPYYLYVDASPTRGTNVVGQWHLENLGTNGVRRGIDINAREAWSMTRGAGITIAIVDDGMDLTHPDLAANIAPNLNWNFEGDFPDGSHPTDSKLHGTAVAGLAAAVTYNSIGVAGVAPDAHLASWVIFKTNGGFVPDEKLAKMFEFKIQDVQIQNHSWGKLVPFGGPTLAPMSDLENAAISNAVTLGRGGKGVIMVRAGGNARQDGRNSNDDAYFSDPRAIAVGGVRFDGRYASRSSAGACLLVAAPTDDFDNGFPGIQTTDRIGTKGYNFPIYTNDFGDYWAGFSGTSASAPQVAGIVALMLSVNPNLTYRDVQQVLLHTAHQTGPVDPDVHPNGAGYLVGHNLGFGTVDAGWAVQVAATWKNRPAATSVSHAIVETKDIPAAGLTVNAFNAATNLPPIACLPDLGIQADVTTPAVPLVDIGFASETVTNDLRGKAALIRRDAGRFAPKLMNAAQAGAVFAIMANNANGDDLLIMGNTELIPIPAVFIGENDGNALANFAANNPDAKVQLKVDDASYNIPVPETLQCEHVGLRVKTTHQRRGDLRITLVSPSGTRSIMENINADDAPGPADWTFWSTHHFYEESAGNWSAHFTDEMGEHTGAVQSVELIVQGVPITDSDKDGLDDAWEMAKFGSLQAGPAEDPDNDGSSNVREQILGTDPMKDERVLDMNIAEWYPGFARLSWPSIDANNYDLLATENLSQPFSLLGTSPGRTPRRALVLPDNGSAHQFFRVVEKPR
jgi:subtilisin family serine protease/subtilisin-like proprotein convertase family protein